MDEIYNNKYNYLKYSMHNKYNITEDDDIYHLIIPLHEYDYSCKGIPECHSCIEDYNAIQTKNNAEIHIRVKCTQSCLWFKWFDNKRQQYAKKCNKKLEYYVKMERTTVKIGKETINKVDFNEYMKLY